MMVLITRSVLTVWWDLEWRRSGPAVRGEEDADGLIGEVLQLRPPCTGLRSAEHELVERDRYDQPVEVMTREQRVVHAHEATLREGLEVGRQRGGRLFGAWSYHRRATSGKRSYAPPTWKHDSTPVALLKAYASYVTFGLFAGQSVNDPSGRLEPGARQMASVKLRSTADIDEALFTEWLRQAGATT